MQLFFGAVGLMLEQVSESVGKILVGQQTAAGGGGIFCNPEFFRQFYLTAAAPARYIQQPVSVYRPSLSGMVGGRFAALKGRTI